jgi:hypothetical protein
LGDATASIFTSGVRRTAIRSRVGDSSVHLQDHRGDQLVQASSGRRRRNTTRRAIEQPHAEATFELPDDLAQGGTRQAEVVGGAREARALDHGHEGPELGKLRAAHCVLGGIDVLVNVLGGSSAPAGGFAVLDDIQGPRCTKNAKRHDDSHDSTVCRIDTRRVIATRGASRRSRGRALDSDIRSDGGGPGVPMIWATPAAITDRNADRRQPSGP